MFLLLCTQSCDFFLVCAWAIMHRVCSYESTFYYLDITVVACRSNSIGMC